MSTVKKIVEAGKWDESVWQKEVEAFKRGEYPLIPNNPTEAQRGLLEKYGFLAPKPSSTTFTKDEFKRLVQQTVNNAIDKELKPAIRTAMTAATITKEVRRPSAWEDNAIAPVDLADFESKDVLLKEWEEARHVKADKDRVKAILDAESILASASGRNFESFEPFPTIEESQAKAKTMSDYEREEAAKEWQFWLKSAEQFPKFVEKRIEEAVKVQLEEDKDFVRSQLKEKYVKQFQVVEAAIPYFKEILEILK